MPLSKQMHRRAVIKVWATRLCAPAQHGHWRGANMLDVSTRASTHARAQTCAGMMPPNTNETSFPTPFFLSPTPSHVLQALCQLGPSGGAIKDVGQAIVDGRFAPWGTHHFDASKYGTVRNLLQKGPLVDMDIVVHIGGYKHALRAFGVEAVPLPRSTADAEPSQPSQA
eukprot:354548-Chlamydomonas_euryale.AAC.5